MTSVGDHEEVQEKRDYRQYPLAPHPKTMAQDELDPSKFDPCNLIINYIPPKMTEHELASLFGSIGEVKKTKIVRDRSTGISLGFGFVEYVDENCASRAVDTFDGLNLQMKRLKVAHARRQDTVGGANVHVRNLDQTVSAKDVERQFSEYGEIIRARVLSDPHTGVSRGIAFVLFASRGEAEVAVNTLDGVSIPGFATSPLSVRFAMDHKTKCHLEAAAAGILPSGFQMPAPGAPPPHPVLAAARSASPGTIGLGAGYGGSLGGGPIRANLTRQRFNPLAGGGGMLGQVPGSRLTVPTRPAAANAVAALPLIPTQTGHTIFVYNLGQDSDDRDLWQLFGPFGAVQKVNIVYDAEKKPRGYGFVTMTNLEEATSAITHLNGFVYKERQLQVSMKTPKR